MKNCKVNQIKQWEHGHLKILLEVFLHETRDRRDPDPKIAPVILFVNCWSTTRARPWYDRIRRSRVLACDSFSCGTEYGSNRRWHLRLGRDPCTCRGRVGIREVFSRCTLAACRVFSEIRVALLTSVTNNTSF